MITSSSVRSCHQVVRHPELRPAAARSRSGGRRRCVRGTRGADYDASVEGLPSGTVTFVFTDIEGSTGLLKQLGERYDELLTDHRRIVRDTFTGLNGVEIDTQGDAFFFAFGRARDAVEAAVEAQRAHASTSWPDDATVRVRMGLHTGEPALGSEGYLGLDVVRAARICTSAKGGNVLLSETTRLLVGSSLPEGVVVHPVGARHLKDIDQPEQVYELAIDGAEAAEAEDEPAVEPPPPPPAAPVPPAPPAEFKDQLKASIQQRVERELQSALRGLEQEAAEEPDAAAVDELAGRTADLGELIAARVHAALRAKGIDPDED